MWKKERRPPQGGAGPAPKPWRKRAIMGILCLLALLLGWKFLQQKTPELPPQAAEQALYNTFGAAAYRFTTTSTVLLDHEQRLFCQLNGEISGANRHIWGELLGTPLNLYLVEGALYQQSALDKSWRRIADADLAQARNLVAEIAPESNFAFEDMGLPAYLGLEDLDGQKLHKVELHPVMADTWIEQFFTDIVSTLWLDEGGQYIVRASTQAVSTENPGVKLVVDNTFSDFNTNIDIKAPL